MSYHHEYYNHSHCHYHAGNNIKVAFFLNFGFSIIEVQTSATVRPPPMLSHKSKPVHPRKDYAPNSRFNHTVITGSGMITWRFSIFISSFFTNARFTILALADELSWCFCKISCVVNSLRQEKILGNALIRTFVPYLFID